MNERLYRSRSDRMLAGVAGGVAGRFDLDPAVVRILWAILILLSGGIFLLIYFVMAIVVPLEPIGGRAVPAGAPPGPVAGRVPGRPAGRRPVVLRPTRASRRPPAPPILDLTRRLPARAAQARPPLTRRCPALRRRAVPRRGPRRRPLPRRRPGAGRRPAPAGRTTRRSRPGTPRGRLAARPAGQPAATVPTDRVRAALSAG